MNPRFIVLVLALAALFLIFRPKQPTVISPVPDDPHVETSIITKIFKPKKNPEELKRIIQERVASQWANYSVYIRDYKSDLTIGINETVTYDAASVNKIPILAALYTVVNKGEIDLQTTITLQSKDIQDYGTGSIRYDKPGSVYTIQTLARLMMQKSDNTAAYILANHILTIKQIQELVNSWGLTQTDMIKNTTSNKDTETVLKLIFDGKIANPALTQEMLAFLKDSDFENRLPANLPAGTVVYHKIGTYAGGVHDAGIVVSPKATYYIGIFTSNITDEPAAEKLIAEVSRDVYDFFNN